jgi:polysaccharide deacetylase 2 family uncharacterized protein YibQ
MRCLLIAVCLLLGGPVWAASAGDGPRPLLALVIDDLGYSWNQARQALELPGNHSYAIIPDTRYDRRIAEAGARMRRELLLHMPMQSASSLALEPATLNDGMDENELTRQVERMLNRLPQIHGINNHMGSRLTAQGYIMRPVMETIRRRDPGLYFLDSKTTGSSQAYLQALLTGVPTLQRDVFLDNDPDPQAIATQIRRWTRKAERRGWAIAIAHPHQSTLDYLQQALPGLLENYRMVTISELIALLTMEKEKWPKQYLSRLPMDSRSSKPSP